MTQGIKEKDIRDFEKYAKKLANVMKRIMKYNPEANGYLSCDSLNLMSCNFHEIERCDQQNFIVASIDMVGFDGGDW